MELNNTLEKAEGIVGLPCSRITALNIQQELQWNRSYIKAYVLECLNPNSDINLTKNL